MGKRTRRYSSVITVLLVLTLLSSSIASAQPQATRQPEPVVTPLNTSPSPPPNPLDINLLDLLPGKENVLLSKSINVAAQSITPGNTNGSTNSSQIPASQLFPVELTSAQPAPERVTFQEPTLDSVMDAPGKEDFLKPQADASPTISGFSAPSDPAPTPQPPSAPVEMNPYEPVSIEVLPDKQGILQSKDGKVKVTFPIGAVTEKVRVEYREQRTQGSTGTRMVRQFELNGYAADRKDAAIKTFSKQLQIAISHTKEELAGLDTRSLRLYYLDETQKRWLPVTGQYDPTARTLTSSTDHFTYYGEQANPNIAGPGQIMAFQVSLQSGTAISRYPIELPPGPGGFQPRLELVYNSGSVDEMKNKRSLGSWVGIGWTFHPGRISYDEEYKSYSLELNGESYEIISADGSYYTKPDMFFKITRTDQTWDIWDKGGTKYQFGGTTDSKQYHDTDQYYRWDLNLVQDTHLNQMTVSYDRDIVGANVRSAYPRYLRYNGGLVEVEFVSSNDQQHPSDGPIRNDNPLTAGNNPAPKVMENRKLDYIEVKAGSPLTRVRKYVFAYTTTASTYSSDYGGIYYSGKHTLTSITQKGADGTSTLTPTPMTFTYSEPQTNLNDSYNPTYTGNPGNPASFNWPHLTQVNNGYGATVTFTYTQNPSGTTNDTWTREVVTQRVINPGIGPNQTNYYTYVGDPKYMWHSWKAKFRGFGQVEEKDAANNVIKHYYYTTGLVNGQDADKLTGKEYKTEWFNSTDLVNPIKQVVYTWEWKTKQSQENKYAFVSQFTSPNNGDGNLNADSGVAVDSNGIYVADCGNNRVQKFNSSYAFVRKWGKLGTGNGEFYCPMAVATDSSGNVYVADSSNHRIQKFDSEGTFSTKWGNYGAGAGQFIYPRGIAVYGTNVFVADTYNHRIQKFSTSGSYLGMWGTYGTGDGQLDTPYGVAANQYGVFVADTYNNRIQKFSDSGTYLGKWGSMGSGDGQFSWPMGVAVDSSNVYVADSSNHRMQKFDTNGTFLAKWGSQGGGAGQVKAPLKISVDSGGNIYVTDRNSRIQKFSAALTSVAIWANAGLDSGRLWYPRDLAADSNYIYLFDLGNNRVYTFDAYGSQLARWGSYLPTMAHLDGAYGGAIYQDNFYVANANWNTVVKLNSSGDYQSQWGSYGSGNGQFIQPTDVATDSFGYVYVVDRYNNRIQKFDNMGVPQSQWAVTRPEGIAIDSGNNKYVTDTTNHLVHKYDVSNTHQGQWGGYGSGDGQFDWPARIGVDSLGKVYVVDSNNYRVQKFSNTGGFITKFGAQGGGFGTFTLPWGVVTKGDDVFVTDVNGSSVQKFSYLWSVRLTQADEIMGSKTTRTIYDYDDYDNVKKINRQGDISDATDNSTVWRAFNHNTNLWIIDKVTRERVYQGDKTSDDDETNLVKETHYYYDCTDPCNSWPTTLVKGELNRVKARINAAGDVADTYYTYDTYGNQLTVKDPNGKTTWFYYDGADHALPTKKTYPLIGDELYEWDYGAGKIRFETDVNNQRTEVQYDPFKRPVKIIRPGDNENSPTIEHRYESWGTINQQRVETYQKVDTTPGNNLWQKRYFDGLGRVVQVQSRGEDEGGTIYTIINITTAFSDRGLTDKEYISQKKLASQVTQYKEPEAGWKYTSYEYDALSRVTTTTKPDNQTIAHDYSTAWQDWVTNELNIQKRYHYDAFGRLVKVQEMDAAQSVYATTDYTYDVLNNLKTVADALSNPTTISYDWLSRKMYIIDPDMGRWDYTYDNNGNLKTQTDAMQPTRQTIYFRYDALNRLNCKSSVTNCAGTIYATYSYDDFVDPDQSGPLTCREAGGNCGKGRRTGMVSYREGSQFGSDEYTYDGWGRTIKEVRTIDSTPYTTEFAYDSASRLKTVTYPGGETVTQGYNYRGLPYSLGSIVSSTLYNQLGQPTEINLGNGLKTTFGYWDMGGTYDNPGNYYGKLWEIKTFKTGSTLQDVKHTWDAGGSLTVRQNLVDSETENFQYDFLDRLKEVTGAYSESYDYNRIGNITCKASTPAPCGTTNYTYGSKPHAVMNAAGTAYTYDGNGNALTRGSQNLTWDAENRLKSVTQAGNTTSFFYDGDGKRVKKVDGPITTVYVNKYYEKTGSEITRYYYLGERLVALKKGTDLKYVHQDHLTGTSVVSNTAGNSDGSIRYAPFGFARAGSVPTDLKFTGQRLDSGIDLYYYGARYYDANIGRFISADSIVPNYKNPQSLNRYSYALNNPLKYKDPTGHLPKNSLDPGANEGGANYPPDEPNEPIIIIPEKPEPGPELPGIPFEEVGIVSFGIFLDYTLFLGPSTVEKLLEKLRERLGLSDADTSELSKSINENQMFIEFGMGLPGPTALRQAHHLIELRFAKRLKFEGIPTKKLTQDEHQPFTNKWREEIPYKNSKKALRTDTATQEDIWNASQRVYKDNPDLLEEVRKYLFGK